MLASRVSRARHANIFRRFLVQNSCIRHSRLYTKLIDELQQRNLVSDITRPDELSEILDEKLASVYAGIDPTAQSLHVGHLLPLLCLLQFQIRGHQVIALIGGATGLIGDPSGRTTQRPLANAESVKSNVTHLTEALRVFFAKAIKYAQMRLSQPIDHCPDVRIMNNIEWFKDMGLLDFLRAAGVHFRVNTMLSKESVQRRMNTESGITFTEFSYQLLQGYDFYKLYHTVGCRIQVGGSDQWGNIVAGIELISKTMEDRLDNQSGKEKSFGITTPLLTTSSGDKFGKSAGNAIWLDEKLTSCYDFYQFFLRTADVDVGRYLKMFTLIPLEQIDEILTRHEASPEKRDAQRLLAEEVTLLIHGEQGLQFARTATKVLFGTDYSSLRADEIINSLAGHSQLKFCEEAELLQVPIVNLVAAFGLTPSRSTARTLVQARGLYLNNVPVANPHDLMEKKSLVDGKVAIFRVGRDRHLLLALK